jgi:hypothetical protein
LAASPLFLPACYADGLAHDGRYLPTLNSCPEIATLVMLESQRHSGCDKSLNVKKSS